METQSQTLKELYNVEKILSKRMRKKKVEYRVKWEGYPLDQSTWEPSENLKTVQTLIQDFEKKRSKKEEGGKILGHKRHREKRKPKDESKLSLNIEKKGNMLTNIDKLTIKTVLTVTVLNKELHGEIQYEDNGKPKKAWVSTQLLKKVVPQLLIDYYEKQIIFN